MHIPRRASLFLSPSGASVVAGCDATTLQPFNNYRYSYSPLYAPQDPADHGGYSARIASHT